LNAPPGSHWFNLGLQQTGTRCDDREVATVANDIVTSRFKIRSATMTVDADVRTPTPVKPKTPNVPCSTRTADPTTENPFKGAPAGTVAKIVEINGAGGSIVRKGGVVQPLKKSGWISPGDILITDKGTTVTVEAINGSRIGINKYVAARFDGEGNGAWTATR
jgi:hypothetical protein